MKPARFGIHFVTLHHKSKGLIIAPHCRFGFTVSGELTVNAPVGMTQCKLEIFGDRI